MSETTRIPVEDPFGAASDPTMPFVADALDPVGAEENLRETLGDESLSVRAIRIVRHKPGKRCLVEYDLESEGSSFTVIGKIRARSVDEKSLAVQKTLWDSSFGGDRFAVARPFGKIPALRMWLQRKERGEVATSMFTEPDGTSLAGRIAELSHALHSSDVKPLRKPHTMDDELRILRERLPLVADARPELRRRIERVLRACEKVGESLPEPDRAPIHRDLYPDQILVDGERLILLDLDLFCEGDPALDIGNFTAHMTEFALRELGSPAALGRAEAALVERFIELSDDRVSDDRVRWAVRVYETLTLARHIHISTRIPERRAFTKDILELCEERLSELKGD